MMDNFTGISRRDPGSRNGFQKRFRSAAFVAALIASGFAPLAALAQEKPAAREDAAPATPEVKTLPPAYEAHLLKLAETLGALHYLREICGANEGQTWRLEMEKLLEAEEPTDDRRAQLIAHFNRGFRGYSEIHRECTPAAADAANQHLRQGVRIATEIPNRYGR